MPSLYGAKAKVSNGPRYCGPQHQLICLKTVSKVAETSP
jgi:hypothetical protein